MANDDDSAKMDAVSDTVDDVLVDDGHAEPHDPDGKMGDDYNYVVATMQGLLLAVAKKLSDQGYQFDPGDIEPASCLPKTLTELKLAIESKTT